MVILFIVVSSVSQESLNAHATDCYHAQRTMFPDDPRCRFTNIQKQLPAPFVVYVDFESILKPVDKDVDIRIEVGGESSSQVFQDRMPCSFAYKVVSSVDPNFSRQLVMYRGENAAEKFVRNLQQEAKQLFDEYIATPKPMLLTATEWRSLTTLPPVIYAQNRLEMIKCEIIVTL